MYLPKYSKIWPFCKPVIFQSYGILGHIFAPLRIFFVWIHKSIVILQHKIQRFYSIRSDEKMTTNFQANFHIYQQFSGKWRFLLIISANSTSSCLQIPLLIAFSLASRVSNNIRRQKKDGCSLRHINSQTNVAYI